MAIVAGKATLRGWDREWIHVAHSKSSDGTRPIFQSQQIEPPFAH